MLMYLRHAIDAHPGVRKDTFTPEGLDEKPIMVPYCVSGENHDRGGDHCEGLLPILWGTGAGSRSHEPSRHP